MNAPAARRGAVVSVFVWLQAISAYNRVRARLRRLRQPKYLLGALAGGAYVYFFFFRQVASRGGAHPGASVLSFQTPFVASLAALVLAVLAFVQWGFLDGRAKLAFSEAEIAFLFPAPLTRTSLIHFALLRSQLAILFSSILMSVLLHRGRALGIGSLHYALGLWLLLSTLSLHRLGAAFTRERWLRMGLRSRRRRWLAALVLVLTMAACAWWMRGVLHWPSADDLADGAAMRAWATGILGAAPLSWLLMPFGWVLAPLFTTDDAAFVRALGPALALLVAHYLWVVRAQVSFEDAAIAHARRLAERLAAARAGRIDQRTPTRPRREPFRLAARGWAVIAFMWKNLIAMGPFYHPRSGVIVFAGVFALCRWMDADPLRRPILAAVGIPIALSGAWIALMGPMIYQSRLRRTIEQMDILKAMPLRGWQIALGELLAPAAVLSAVAWLIVLIGEQAIMAAPGAAAHLPLPIVPAAIGVGLIVPPLLALMLCLPFAGLLWFPAWTASGASGRGFEVMGQRLLVLAAYVVTLLVAAIPAALLGGLGYLLGHWLAAPTLAALAAALLACAALVFELACAVDLLGRRIDRFDLSQELR